MNKPLAHRLRPENIDQVIGQKHLVGDQGIIRKMLENNSLFSMILFGPPGIGKTTLATVIAKTLQTQYRMFNAVTGNKKELDAIFAEGKMSGGLIVIVEEIHRLNKNQQDLLLPHLEDGTITIIGTTTANPYFAINPAIRSRTHLFELKPIEDDEIFKFLKEIASSDEFKSKHYDDEALQLMINHASGDLRTALNIFEICSLAEDNIDVGVVHQYSQQARSHVDKNEGGFYDLLSAFQKSIRGSDVDAALYYLAQLILSDNLDAINRRLVVIAYEDIGLGNPNAVSRTLDAVEVAERVGLPEASIPLSVAVVDLALSPKSKSACLGVAEAISYSRQHQHDVPTYLKQTPVGLNEDEKYDFNRPDLWHKIQYLPNALKDTQFYKPKENSAYEKALAQNYYNLKKIKRSTDIKKLKNQS